MSEFEITIHPFDYWKRTEIKIKTVLKEIYSHFRKTNLIQIFYDKTYKSSKSYESFNSVSYIPS